MTTDTARPDTAADPQSYATTRDAAVRALGAAARLTHTMPDGRTEQIDFADFLAQVLAEVAANVGSTEQLLAGRSGSWEADHVRNLLVGTVGHDDEYLLAHRTEPIRLMLDPEDVFCEFGLYQLWADDVTVADAACDATKTDAELDAAVDTFNAVDALWKDDLTAYVEAYTVTARAAAAALAIEVPVEVLRIDLSDPVGRGAAYLELELGITARLHELARTCTVVPATGKAPREHSGQTVADVARAAGRTYRARVEASKSPGSVG